MSAPILAIDALRAGSANYKLAVLIEGYPYILTDAVASNIVTAWDGFASDDFAQALTGLVVDLQQSQKLDPLDPLQGGGQCRIYMPNTATDEFGIATHQTAGGLETELTATLDRTATTMTVASTLNFPSSGIVYVGTEAISYAGKTSNTFTGLVRGLYSPFATSTGGRFAHEHNVNFFDFQTKRNPIVSSQPRSWVGRWVGVWLHHIIDGRPCTADAALLLYAGKITAIRDDAATLHTVVELRHLLDVIKEGSIGSSPWTAELGQGVKLTTGMQFKMQDWKGTTTLVANPLNVVSTPPGANEIADGYYNVDDIYNLLNAWLNDEIAAGRLNAAYYSVELSDDGIGANVIGNPVTKIRWRTSGTAGTSCGWTIDWPEIVGDMLGFMGLAQVSWQNQVNTDAFRQSGHAPNNQSAFQQNLNTTGLNFEAAITRETGVFIDNYAVLPASMKRPNSLGLGWGLFSVDNKFLIVAARSGSKLVWAGPAPAALAGFDAIDAALSDYKRDINDSTPIIVRQIFAIESTLAGLLKLLLFSTGTSGYNDATWDKLGSTFGLAVPAQLLANVATSLDSLPGATNAQLAIIDKPTKLGGDKGVLAGELLLRRAFPVWKLGSLAFSTWQTPTAFNYLASLDETTKAEAASAKADHRTVTQLTEIGMKNSIKVEYNRDITHLNTEAYANVVTLIDAVAIDDAGGEARNYTISARNTYSQYAATGAGIEALLPQFLGSLTMFSRPLRTIRRSIDPRFYEGLAPGDVVLVSDLFARDPSTGRRRVTGRPGLVIAHRYNLGGVNPGNPKSVRGMAGEVDIVFLDLNRIGPYAPSARVDETASTGGFTAGFNGSTTIRCKAHEYSESTELADAARFLPGDKVLLTELDPANSGSPLSWSRTIAAAGVSGNDITFTVALATPTFDTSKKYALTYDHFAILQATQTANASQADGDSLVEDVASPFQYGYALAPTTPTVSTHTDPIERYAQLAYGDGKARDVGYDRALCRLLNNLHDHKTRHVGPYLANTVMTNTVYAGYRLLSIVPIYLTREQATANTLRFLSVAPFFRSSDGTSVTIRVTLTREMPNGASLNDVGIASLVSSSQTWTTTSTTWQTGAEQDLACNVKQPGSGIAYLLIESTIKGECRGLGQCNESERVYIP